MEADIEVTLLIREYTFPRFDMRFALFIDQLPHSNHCSNWLVFF